MAASKIESCVAAIKNWMASNRLKLNSSRTELVWVALPHELTKFAKPQLTLVKREFALQRQLRASESLSTIISNLQNIYRKFVGHVFSRCDN